MREHGLPQSAKLLTQAEGARLLRCAAGDARLRRARPRCTRCGSRLDVHPVFKRVDTCAAEFAAPTAYMYSTYEAPFAGAPQDEAQPSDRSEGHHPRRRPEPHRPGHRVRLLLLPRRLRARRGRPRVDHGQLQPGDRVDRLRHLRPPLLRAADRRRRAGDRARGTVARHAARRHRAVRRADAAEARRRAAGGERADPRHLARRHRPRRGPRPLRKIPDAARPAPGEERHRLFGRAGAPRRARARPAAGRAPLLRARRPRHADHPRGGCAELLPARHAARAGAGRRPGPLSERQDRADQYRARQEPAALRPLPLRCDRGGRRCALRRTRCLRLRRDGAHRGGRHPFRRLRLLAAAALAAEGDDRRDRAPDGRARHRRSAWSG